MKKKGKVKCKDSRGFPRQNNSRLGVRAETLTPTSSESDSGHPTFPLFPKSPRVHRNRDLLVSHQDHRVYGVHR